MSTFLPKKGLAWPQSPDLPTFSTTQGQLSVQNGGKPKFKLTQGCPGTRSAALRLPTDAASTTAMGASTETAQFKKQAVPKAE
jgi:hypothetical protein